MKDSDIEKNLFLFFFLVGCNVNRFLKWDIPHVFKFFTTSSILIKINNLVPVSAAYTF